MWFRSSRRNGPAKSTRRPWSFRPALEALEDRALPSGFGSLDPAFGQGGLVTTAIGSQAQSSALALQPDGKLVVGGWSFFGTKGKSFTLARYTGNGALDNSFGTGSVVQTPPPAHTAGTQIVALALQGDGKIVAVGEASVSSRSTSNDTEFEVARYNPNGTLDSSFGGGKNPNGIVLTNLGSDLDQAGGVAVQSDGKIVVAGYQRVVSSTQTTYKIEMVRYNANGTLDTAFGSGGSVLTPVANMSGAGSLVIQGDGKLLVGVSAGSVGLARYLPTGQLDPSFGSHGITTGNLPPGAATAWLSAVVLRGDGTIFAAGNCRTVAGPYQLALAHFGTAGQLDTSFGHGGWATDSLYPANAAAVAPNGDVLVAGYSTSVNPADFAVAAFLPTGAPDPSFGTNGRVTTDFGSSDDGARGIVVQPDGNFVAAGFSGIGTNNASYRFALARYLPSGPQIGSFTADPNPVTAGGSVTLTASNIIAANPSSSITQVAFYRDSNGDGILEPSTERLGQHGVRGAA